MDMKRGADSHRADPDDGPAAQVPGPARQGAVGAGEGGHRRELLRDRRDAVDARLARAGIADRPVVDEPLAVVGADHTSDDLPERRLPGAVRPDERVHGSSGNLDADVIERLGAGVPFANRDELDRRDRW
jgi:hypothetical protein